MLGCSFPTPIWLRLRRGGCGVSMRIGARMLASTDSPWLSERRAQRKASSTAHPATAPPQVCPVATRRGRRLWVAFLLGTFLWRSKEQVPRPLGRDPASALNNSARAIIKTIAASACHISARAQKHHISKKQRPPARRLKTQPPTPAPAAYAPRPQPGWHGASPPGCAPRAWRRSRPCRPHSTPTAHPAGWHRAPPGRCSHPA